MSVMHSDSKIFVAGHRGMVGSAIVRKLQEAGFTNLVLRSRQALDLTKQHEVDAFFSKEKPEFVFLAAAKVGGILANSNFPANFLLENLSIQNNVIDASWKHQARKLLFLGSSCIYPRDCPQPIKESYLLTGPLEPTNEAYAVAKIAGIKLCQAYRRQYGFDAICAMPTNLYGPGDNYHLENSHVVPALIKRINNAIEVDASKVVVWGTGKPLRELMHVDDLASALLLLMQKHSSAEIVNVGSGEEISIGDLATRIGNASGYHGEIEFDITKPDGTPRKLLDTSRLREYGWRPRISLNEGLANTVREYKLGRR